MDRRSLVQLINKCSKIREKTPADKIGCTDCPDGYIIYWVTVYGETNPEEVRDNIFNGTMNRIKYNPDSHGFGLSIVKRIMERLNGFVSVESTAQGREALSVSA